MLDIAISEYDPAWASTFQSIRSDLLSILQDVPLISILHVGSTSVPGLAAKPMIDIDIVVSPEHVFAAFARLSTRGYTYNPETWLPDRASFRYNGHTHDQGASKPTEDGQPRRMVYLVLPTSGQLKRHRILKRVLLSHPELRDEYGDVKRELAKSQHADIGAYGKAKSEVIERIYAKGAEIGETGEMRGDE